MNKTNLLIIALVVIISILAVAIYLQQSILPDEPVSQPAQAPPETEEKQAIVHYPVPVPNQVQPPEGQQQQEEIAVIPPLLPKKLPPVQQSDESIQQALANLKINKSLYNLILQENFIQRLVVTIDSLTEKRLPRAHLPLTPPKGRFSVSGTTEEPQTSPSNRSRYDDHMRLFEKLNQDLVIKIYVHFYPLFQTAYQQLGYKNAYFNDRLVAVIDHLLETPSPAEPILLSQPSVLYVYADPLLEQLSCGQKILLRIGPENRGKIKKILKSYRERLANLQQ